MAMAGCGATSGGPGGPTPSATPNPVAGSIQVTYQFSGVEAPTRISVLLIDGNTTGLTCQSLAYKPTQGIEAQQNNLPATGVSSFPNLTDGSRWIVFASGSRGNNVRVADACIDNITVRRDETTSLALTLLNRPLNVSGDFDTSLKLNLELPGDVVTTLLLLDLGCQALGLGAQYCDITSELIDILTDLDVEATWAMSQTGGVVSGEMIWNSVQGVDVGQWDLVSGGFIAEIPGATGLQFKAHSLGINFDELVMFLIQDVMEVDLGLLAPIVGIVIDMLADELVSDITIVDAVGTAVDTTNDGVAETITGEMDATISFPAMNYTHEFTIDWNASRS